MQLREGQFDVEIFVSMGGVDLLGLGLPGSASQPGSYLTGVTMKRRRGVLRGGNRPTSKTCVGFFLQKPLLKLQPAFVVSILFSLQTCLPTWDPPCCRHAHRVWMGPVFCQELCEEATKDDIRYLESSFCL
jgi:hypothetical protein